MKNYMAVDQYGTTFHGLQHPRKDLLEKVGRSHASKMFVDTKAGQTLHVGYIIGQQWFTVYEVNRMEKVA